MKLNQNISSYEILKHADTIYFFYQKLHYKIDKNIGTVPENEYFQHV